MSKCHVSLVRELRECGRHEAALTIEAEEYRADRLEQENTDLRAQLAAWKARCERRVADIHEASKRHELVLEQLRAANKRIEEAEKQEPVAWEYYMWEERDGCFPQFYRRVSEFLPHNDYRLPDGADKPIGWDKYWKNPAALTRQIPPADVADKE